MSYVVLARKWRPMTFSDLVGQDHVSQTLGNAIAQGRVAHAFLFTGVRGVGKTTSARILAKALNCLSSSGPTATPCLTCSACKEITDGSDVDVQEIDGASYNGVDEVRRLQESLPYRPNRDRFKIIIVDEVHMLSSSAWNAFLKTLEEPPPHVKFIFATTEAHKVPVTILSRVQRFDFKLIPARLIIERLRFVLNEEKIQADDAALSIIARQAAGSMRDAMSLLDQVIAWSQEDLTGETVARVLGVASRKALLELARALIEGRAQSALELVEAISNQGFDLVHVARDLLAVLRDAVVAAVAENYKQLIDLPEEEVADIETLVPRDADDLLRLHQGFSQGYDDVARSAQPRAALEMLLVRLARRPPLLPINDLIDRLSRLERRIATGTAGRGSGGTSGALGGGKPGASAERRVSRATTSAAPASATPSASRPPATPATPPTPSAPQPKPKAFPSLAAPKPTRTEPVASVPEPTRTAPEPTRTEPVASDPEPTRTEPVASAPTRTEPNPAPVASAPEPARDQAPSAPPEEPEPFEQLSTVERWRRIVDLIRAGDPKLGAFLDHAEVLSVEVESFRLKMDRSSVFYNEVTSSSTLSKIKKAAFDCTGKEPDVHFDAGEPGQNNGQRVASDTLFAKDKEAREERERQEIERAQSHPVVLEAIRVFGARVKNIDLPKSDA